MNAKPNKLIRQGLSLASTSNLKHTDFPLLRQCMYGARKKCVPSIPNSLEENQAHCIEYKILLSMYLILLYGIGKFNPDFYDTRQGCELLGCLRHNNDVLQYLSDVANRFPFIAINYTKMILRPSFPEMYYNETQPFIFAQRNREINRNHVIIATVLLIIGYHLKQHASAGSSVLFGIICSLIGLALAPILGVLLAVFSLYREYVKMVLSKKKGYMGLMDGSDAYWTLENDTSRPVINVLAFVDFSTRSYKRKGIDEKTIVRAVIQSRLLTDPNLFKLQCLRRLSEYGYYYWVEHKIDIDMHIRWMDLESPTMESVQDFVSKTSNNPLPYENQSFWEILVCRESLKIEGKKVNPVLFRVHHAVGDGIALVRLFLDSLTDHKEGNTPELSPMEKIQQKYKLIEKLSKQGSKSLEKSVLQMAMTLGSPLIKRSSLTKFNKDLANINKHCIYAMTGTLQKISVIMFAPIVLISQCLMGTDKSSLHGPQLSGEKIVVWNSGMNTMSKVRTLKERLKCHFTDVLLLAISNSFEDYLSLFGQSPDTFTLVIPARLPTEEKVNGQTIPSNAFTVAMMKLPISNSNKFGTVCQASRKLRIDPSYLVNYWLLKVACTYFPITLLREALVSKQATMAMSNIPGPANTTQIDGNNIEDLFFWPPNRDTTGVGLSILSYAGKLNFGMLVDKALISRREDAQNILDGIIKSIDNMYTSLDVK